MTPPDYGSAPRSQSFPTAFFIDSAHCAPLLAAVTITRGVSR